MAEYRKLTDFERGILRRLEELSTRVHAALSEARKSPEHEAVLPLDTDDALLLSWAVADYFKRATDFPVKTSLYDEQERHENCTVEIWRNSLTGEVSIGWWKNGEGDH